MICFLRFRRTTFDLTLGIVRSYAWRRRLSTRVSPFVLMIVARRRCRFRFESLFVRMWLLLAFRRRIFPVPVTEKRFFAPLCVFILGIVQSCLFWRKNHCELLAFELGRALDLGDVPQFGRDSIDHCHAQLRVRDLTPAEHQRDLDLVFLLQEPPRMPRFRREIMLVDAGAVLHFLELYDVLLLLRDPRLFGLL